MRLSTAICLIAPMTVMCGTAVSQVVTESSFDEHPVQFQNESVTLAGVLLLPPSAEPIPAVLFVHGAGRHTRESQREVAEHFASQGIAALIYDKRGTGESGGVYESHQPYENLVTDALSAVALLKKRNEIADSQIGIWGLSQGAYISAAAASRTEDIGFVITAGASVADGMMLYYRDNLFRHFGLSEGLRDVAEKAHLAVYSLPHNSQDGFGLSSFAPRSYPPPDQYLHPAWSQVSQPVLAMWGQFDQNVPVGESIAGLKNSLAHASNENWTVIILPKSNHDLGISETGELKEKWRGYAPGALKTMTDWAHNTVDEPSQIDRMKQEGSAQETGVVSILAGYERLRWYGNGVVQGVLSLLFVISFLSNTVVWVGNSFRQLFRRQQSTALPASNRVVNFKRAICALNLLILLAFSAVVLFVIEQWRPSCPFILLYLPLLGTVSTVATVALLIVLIRTRHAPNRSIAKRLRDGFDVMCLVLFVPYLQYWNLIGSHF